MQMVILPIKNNSDLIRVDVLWTRLKNTIRSLQQKVKHFNSVVSDVLQLRLTVL